MRRSDFGLVRTRTDELLGIWTVGWQVATACGSFFIIAGRARHLLSSKADKGARFFKNIVGFIYFVFRGRQKYSNMYRMHKRLGLFFKKRKEIKKEIDLSEMDHWGIKHQFGGDKKALAFS